MDSKATKILTGILALGIVCVVAFWAGAKFGAFNAPLTPPSMAEKQNTQPSNRGQSNENASTKANMPPQEAIAACNGKAIGDTCQFSGRDGEMSGICNDKPGVIACAPERGQGASQASKVGQTASGRMPGNRSSNSQQGQQQKQKPASRAATSSSDTLPASANACISNTKDNPQCKDCCDCLGSVDGGTRTKCRDTCATHDFSQNSNFIVVASASVLGANGDYSQCTTKASSSECKICCEGSMGLQCGDYRHCRTACNNKFGDSNNPAGGANQAPTNERPPVGKRPNDQNAQNTPGPESQTQPNGSPPEGGGGVYNIEQAISDRAQLNTLAFDGLGFITGDLCSDSFLPPGKVADFFGFQYLRDTTKDGKGHSTDFVTNSANNVLYTLNDEQKAKMISLAKNQVGSVNDFAYKRYPLMKAFRRNLEGDLPSGTSGLNKEAVMAFSAGLYELDANISIQRAKLYASIINSVSSDQKAYLDKMVSGGFASWPALGDQVDKRSLSVNEHVLVMTYASEMFGWYAGDVEADTYFCPERQGDYFGGFYIKDAPAIGNAGYTIDESITGDAGEAFIAALDISQQQKITGIVDTQRTAINGIVEKRRAISAELRKALTGGAIDEAKVRSLAREYGSLDGEISYYYATAFAQVGKTLTAEQKAKMIGIRNLDGYSCSGAYLYSERIDMPNVGNTDFLFK